jgi:hypothetical protein
MCRNEEELISREKERPDVEDTGLVQLGKLS